MLTWLWHIIAPAQLHSLLLVVAGLHFFALLAHFLLARDVDLAGALAYGWDGARLLHDARTLSRLLLGVYAGAVAAYLLVPSVLVAVLAWLILAALVVMPNGYAAAPLRRHMAASLRRTLSPLDWHSPTLLADIVMGDVLTSYAKVFAEWDALLFCYLLPAADGRCLPSILSVLLVCYPSFCRLRQCVADYRSTGTLRPVLNAAKYATSFPVVYVAFLLLSPQAHPRWRLIWLVLVSINTGASILWDTLVDWDLLQGDKAGRLGLRASRPLSVRRSFYYGAALVNTLARCSWMVRVVATAYAGKHWIGAFLESADALFVLQLVEILRRFVWLALRVESHQVQATPSHLRTLSG